MRSPVSKLFAAGSSRSGRYFVSNKTYHTSPENTRAFWEKALLFHAVLRHLRGIKEKRLQVKKRILACSHPIYTQTSGAGGVRAMDGWYLSRRYLHDDQEALLRSLIPGLQPEQQKTMEAILTAFAKPQVSAWSNRIGTCRWPTGSAPVNQKSNRPTVIGEFRFGLTDREFIEIRRRCCVSCRNTICFPLSEERSISITGIACTDIRTF